MLALRCVLPSAFCIGVICGLAAFFVFAAAISTAIITGACMLAVSFIIIYAFMRQRYFRRIKRLSRVVDNITHKKFGNYENFDHNAKDELDELIGQSVLASKTIEREIQRLNRIENYRKEFIGDISHELKTPIFAVQGFIETLLNGAIEDEEVNRVFLEKAMRNVDRLTYLTRDLMEISKLETGELKSEITHIYLHDVVGEVVENLQYKAEKEHINLKFEEFDKNIMVSADRNQIKQALFNLIENAMKYNKPHGRVTVGAKRYSKDRDRILVYVKDTGIGMEQQYIDRVTERFFRIDKSRSREKGGTGLGLAIVKHIMEAHEQDFFINSAPDAGSTFSFTLQKVERTVVSI
jgi:two-component system phosphate regulon sensor histidine kinase PhoR